MLVNEYNVEEAVMKIGSSIIDYQGANGVFFDDMKEDRELNRILNKYVFMVGKKRVKLDSYNWEMLLSDVNYERLINLTVDTLRD